MTTNYSPQQVRRAKLITVLACVAGAAGRVAVAIGIAEGRVSVAVLMMPLMIMAMVTMTITPMFRGKPHDRAVTVPEWTSGVFVSAMVLTFSSLLAVAVVYMYIYSDRLGVGVPFLFVAAALASAIGGNSAVRELHRLWHSEIDTIKGGTGV